MSWKEDDKIPQSTYFLQLQYSDASYSVLNIKYATFWVPTLERIFWSPGMQDNCYLQKKKQQ